jgi:hypothetical protein
MVSFHVCSSAPWLAQTLMARLVVTVLWLSQPEYTRADLVWTSSAPYHIDALLERYSASYAPLSPYAATMVAALRAMDTDVEKSTAPVMHAVSGNRTFPVHPIGFAIPPEYVRSVVPAKAQGLVTVIPGDRNTYRYLPRPGMSPAELASLEREYYVDMERSLFGLTWKKAGWDCLRHLELLAAGSLPLFTDIDAAPQGAVAFLPKRVLSALLRFPGIDALSGVPGLPSPSGGTRNVSVNMSAVDPVLYSLTVTALLDYTRRHLTTPAMAAQMLSVMGAKPPFCRLGQEALRRHGVLTSAATALGRRRWRGQKWAPSVVGLGSVSPSCPHGPIRVLYLTQPTGWADYMADTLAHGLVSLLGPDAVVQYPRRDVLYTTPSLLFEAQRAPVRTGHYGAGFSYANLLFDITDAADPTLAAAGGPRWGESPDAASMADDKKVSAVEARLRASIAAREFDFVVFGLVHRGPPPLMDAVCASYPRDQIAAVHGNDFPPNAAEIQACASCAGFFFAREAMFDAT